MIEDKDGDVFATMVISAFLQGAFAFCAGVLCHPGFVYLAEACSVKAPGFWSSIGIVFILRQLCLLLSNVRLLSKE